MRAAIVADLASRLIIETTEHHAARCKGRGNAFSIIGIKSSQKLQNEIEPHCAAY